MVGGKAEAGSRYRDARSSSLQRMVELSRWRGGDGSRIGLCRQMSKSESMKSHHRYGTNQ